MSTATHRFVLAAAALLAGGSYLARGQALLYVTGVSRPGGASFEAAGGQPRELFAGRSVSAGVVRVESGAQLMLFEPSGVVVIAVGPATVAVSRDDATNAVRLELRDGKLVFIVSREGEGRPLVVAAVASEQPRVAIELPIGPGRTAVVRVAGKFGVAYAGDGGPPAVNVRVNEAQVSVPSGQLLTLDDAGQPQVGPAGDWLAQQGLIQPWGRVLGVASAHAARADIHVALFKNIIAWDRYAGATYVSAALREYRFSLEIRQTVQTVTLLNRPAATGGTVQTVPFNAANEVPALSPASASVQNIRDVGQGVTAIVLNNIAAALLQATGSQGLGFRGLQQLSVPGFFGPGFRTPGPSGLGAE